MSATHDPTVTALSRTGRESPPQANARVEPVRAGLAQRSLPAFLASSVVHLVILLLLALITFGSTNHGATADLVIVERASTDVYESDSFSIAPEPSEPNVEAPQVSAADIRINAIAIGAPPPLRLASVEQATKEIESPQPSDVEAAANGLAGTVDRIAGAIQERVSNAGGQQGEVQFALAWKNFNDVDLHVIAPSGERVSHLHRQSRGGGKLDVDMNVKPESDTPVENVRWLRSAPWGRYTVIINLFRIHQPATGRRVARSSRFQLLSKLGEENSIKNETVRRGDQIKVFRFLYVPQSVSPDQRAEYLANVELLQSREEEQAAPLLERAAGTSNQRLRDRLLNNIVVQFPHTDSAIEAMQLLGGNIIKE